MARRSFTDTLRDIRAGEVIDQLDEQLQELVRARPMVGTSHGRPAAGDLRGLAAILLRMDTRPLRVVAAPAAPKPAASTQ